MNKWRLSLNKLVKRLVLFLVSTELNKLVKRLDKRYSKSRNSKNGIFKSKPRIPACPSKLCVPLNYSNWAVKPDCIPSQTSQTPVSRRSGLSSLLTDKSASDSDLSSSDSWRYSAWCIQILCCVLFFSMVNKPVGGAWCNWNEPAVINHSWIRAKPREGGHLAARLTDSLCVSTEKLQTPSGYSTDSALKVRHKCSLYDSFRYPKIL